MQQPTAISHPSSLSLMSLETLIEQVRDDKLTPQDLLERQFEVAKRYNAQHDYAQARKWGEEALKHALCRGEKRDRANYQLGLIEQHDGNKEKALDYFKKAAFYNADAALAAAALLREGDIFSEKHGQKKKREALADAYWMLAHRREKAQSIDINEKEIQEDISNGKVQAAYSRAKSDSILPLYIWNESEFMICTHPFSIYSNQRTNFQSYEIKAPHWRREEKEENTDKAKAALFYFIKSGKFEHNLFSKQTEEEKDFLINELMAAPRYSLKLLKALYDLKLIPAIYYTDVLKKMLWIPKPYERAMANKLLAKYYFHAARVSHMRDEKEKNLKEAKKHMGDAKKLVKNDSTTQGSLERTEKMFTTLEVCEQLKKKMAGFLAYNESNPTENWRMKVTQYVSCKTWGFFPEQHIEERKIFMKTAESINTAIKESTLTQKEAEKYIETLSDKNIKKFNNGFFSNRLYTHLTNLRKALEKNKPYLDVGADGPTSTTLVPIINTADKQQQQPTAPPLYPVLN